MDQKWDVLQSDGYDFGSSSLRGCSESKIPTHLRPGFIHLFTGHPPQWMVFNTIPRSVMALPYSSFRSNSRFLRWEVFEGFDTVTVGREARAFQELLPPTAPFDTKLHPVTWKSLPTLFIPLLGVCNGPLLARSSGRDEVFRYSTGL